MRSTALLGTKITSSSHINISEITQKSLGVETAIGRDKRSKMNIPVTDKTRKAIIGATSIPASPGATSQAASASASAGTEPAAAANIVSVDVLEKIYSKLEAISDGMNDIRRDVNDIKTELNDVKEGLSEVKSTTVKVEAKLEQELSTVKGELTATRSQLENNKLKLAVAEQMMTASTYAIRSLSTRLTQMENRNRKCNVIVDGLPDTNGEDLLQKIIDLAVRICPGKVHPESIQSVYRLGKSTQGGNRGSAKKTRPVMVVFGDVRTRNDFYFARTKLKSMDQLSNVYINDDVTIETKRARDEYRSVAIIARNAGAMVRIHDDGLVLNGTKYKLFEPDTLPAEYSLDKAKTITTPQGIFFHSESSYLSNFYPSPIWAEGKAYPTAEHRYQALKCKMAGEIETMKRVIAAPSPLDAKRIADQIIENAEWRSKREEVMQQAITEKFAQNNELAKKLINTGNAKLFEATSNSFFGIGATLHSREVRDMSFKGLNKLGDLLQAKRAELVSSLNGN